MLNDGVRIEVRRMGAGHGLHRAVDRNIPAVVDDGAVDHAVNIRGSALFDDDVASESEKVLGDLYGNLCVSIAV